MNGSWRTSISGIVAAASAFVVFAQGTFHIPVPPIIQALAAFVMIGGLASLGINGKDARVTGGDIVQQSSPAAILANQVPVVAPLPTQHFSGPAVDPIAQKKAVIAAQHNLEK